MADFCRQCSILMFGEDFGDLASHEFRVSAVCEGCGFIWVDGNGRCLDHTDHQHMVFILGADYVAKLDKAKADQAAQGAIEGRRPHPNEHGDSD